MQVNTNTLDSRGATMSEDVGDAGGVTERHWYVAIVNHNTEKNTAERLQNLGYDTYVATQPEYRLWRNGRRAKIDRVVIPSTIFIRCSEAERLRALKSVPQIFRFLTNRAAKQGDAPAPPAIIPEIQLHKLRFMLGNAERPVGFAPRQLAKGDKVRVIRGGLRGLEGEVLHVPTSKSAPTPPPIGATSTDSSSFIPDTELIVRLDILGCARVSINPLDLQPL